MLLLNRAAIALNPKQRESIGPIKRNRPGEYLRAVMMSLEGMNPVAPASHISAQLSILQLATRGLDREPLHSL
jgi:hypothetical protein